MATATIIVPRKDWKPSDVAKSMEHPGKSAKRVAGGWIHDLCASKKVICLCTSCTHKFNPGRLGYIREKEFPVVQAKCDGCGTFDIRATAYFFEETYFNVRSTKAERRANRRKSETNLKREGTLSLNQTIYKG